MKSLNIYVLFFSLTLPAFIYSHGQKPYRVYHPARVYKKNNFKIPTMQENSIAVIGDQQIKKIDYKNWLRIKIGHLKDLRREFLVYKYCVDNLDITEKEYKTLFNMFSAFKSSLDFKLNGPDFFIYTFKNWPSYYKQMQKKSYTFTEEIKTITEKYNKNYNTDLFADFFYIISIYSQNIETIIIDEINNNALYNNIFSSNEYTEWIYKNYNSPIYLEHYIVNILIENKAKKTGYNLTEKEINYFQQERIQTIQSNVSSHNNSGGNHQYYFKGLLLKEFNEDINDFIRMETITDIYVTKLITKKSEVDSLLGYYDIMIFVSEIINKERPWFIEY